MQELSLAIKAIKDIISANAYKTLKEIESSGNKKVQLLVLTKLKQVKKEKELIEAYNIERENILKGAKKDFQLINDKIEKNFEDSKKRIEDSEKNSVESELNKNLYNNI